MLILVFIFLSESILFICWTHTVHTHITQEKWF